MNKRELMNMRFPELGDTKLTIHCTIRCLSYFEDPLLTMKYIIAYIMAFTDFEYDKLSYFVTPEFKEVMHKYANNMQLKIFNRGGIHYIDLVETVFPEKSDEEYFEDLKKESYMIYEVAENSIKIKH